MRNIVLICLDSVRKDIYDTEMAKTKELVDFSADECRAASSWSVPSHSSFLTGQLPHEHGVHTHSIDFSILEESEVLTTRLPTETSISISANHFTSTHFGFDTWFDECYTNGSTSYYHPNGLDVSQTEGIIDHAIASLNHDYPVKSFGNGIASAAIKIGDQLPIRVPLDDGAAAIQRTSARILEEASEPYFLFVNLMEAHHPHRLIRKYEQGEEVPNRWSSTERDLMQFNRAGKDFRKSNHEYIENFRSLYRAAVEYLDRSISEFVTRVQEQSNEEVTFVITADHGENIGYEADQFLFGHTASLSEGLLRVPLDIINPPTEIEIDSGRLFSQMYLRDMIEAMAKEKSVMIPDNRFVAAELIGGGPLEDADEYWDRMHRCVYDNEDRIKVTWDTAGSSYQESLDGSQESNREPIDEIPKWATEQFKVGIEEYKRQAKSDDTAAMDSIDLGTKDRLERLGYL